MNRITTTALAAFILSAGAAAAQECSIDKDPWDLTGEEVTAVYACLEGALLEGYQSGDNAVAAVYRDWTLTQTRPGLAGPHGERFLNTFANDAAADTYMQFAYEGVEMPVGSVLAKESFRFNDDGSLRRGPLFIMEKVAAGAADEFDNWVYDAVQPNGNPMRISQAFCHDCHVAYSDQDNLGYPLEEIRIAAE